MMAWSDNLLPGQRTAASHVGRHARLLAGPGTGKTLTLTRRVCFLVEDQGIAPANILALTFTRAAAHELRQRIQTELGSEILPRVSTLHSFALRQLLRNATRITLLPQPLRIADDWEERHIILEDLKRLLGLQRIDHARDLLNELSADWQSLTADEADWERRFPNPQFLGAWREHRTIYGYVLRAELVYQLKRALEQDPDFAVDGSPTHLLVDEYQDLNRCDLAVVKAIADRGVEVYCAGDDDQSIYGFRKAHPEGIRRFPQDYQHSQPLTLEICKRCDPAILDLALFVARQDHRRLEKPLHAEEGRTGGEVAVLRFANQDEEATSVAKLCKCLVQKKGLEPDDILLLLRSDRNRAFSSVLNDALTREDLATSVATAESDPLDEAPGRQVLALLRLVVHADDHLAWRTLFELRQNLLGEQAISALYQLGISRGVSFARAVQAVAADPSLIPRHGARLKAEYESIRQIGDALRAAEPNGGAPRDQQSLLEAVGHVVHSVTTVAGEASAITARFATTLETIQPENLEDLVRALEISNESLEQEITEGKINILTMHRAKGLTAKAVVVLAVEDEYLPGRAQGDQLGDERRLLYVSLTRAKHYLFMTFCQRRTGQQQHTGRTSGTQRRTLTQFLQGAPVTPVSGVEYVQRLEGDDA
jgi:DNA helicase-2/ATP-dependent DNA helicase PcrA